MQYSQTLVIKSKTYSSDFFAAFTRESARLLLKS